MTESLNTNNEKSSLEQCLESIYAQLENVPEKDKKKAFRGILEGYGIDWKEEYDAMWIVEEEIKPEVKITRVEPVEEKEVKPKKKRSYKTLKEVGKGALLLTGGVVGMMALNLKNTENKENELNKEDYIETPIQERPKPKQENTVDYNPRFKMETYSSLPERGKDVYTYFANYNPTPGRGYMMLDKDSALQYVFNDRNELVAKITAGYGKEMGDEHNTSYKENTGRTTTPAGSYILSNATTEGDRKKYGDMQYSLFGVSVLGQKETLGLHQTYPGQLELRTNLLNTPTVADNKFSDGCVNVPVEEFTKNIKPYFQGDGGEIMIILPDAKSRESGVKFSIDVLVKNALEMIVGIADKQEEELRKRLSMARSEEEYSETKARIDKLMIRRARAMQILEGK